jgi:plasmid stabilization system protein ParE
MRHRVVDLHPGAVEDIRQARDWYHSRDEIAARAFFSEIEGALDRIVERPEAWPQYVPALGGFFSEDTPSASSIV